MSAKAARITIRKSLLSNIVRRIDTMDESRVPSLKNALHNLDASEINILDRGRESTLLGRLEEVHTRLLARVRTVEIRSRAHDDDAAEVDELGGGSAKQHLESRVILLGCGAIVACAVGDELGVVRKGFAEESAAVVDIRGCNIAFDDGGRGEGGRVEV
jgi:hypothetical protein